MSSKKRKTEPVKSEELEFDHEIQEVEETKVEAKKEVEPQEGFSNPEAKRKAPQRTMKGSQDVYHDLFVLNEADVVRDISFTDKVVLEKFPHKHHYHSVNSDGIPQDKSSPALGHFHFMKIKEVDGELIAECGPPMKFGFKKIVKKGKTFKKKAIIPVEGDDHTHKVEYKFSEVFKQRTFSKEAMESISAITNNEAALLKNPLA